MVATGVIQETGVTNALQGRYKNVTDGKPKPPNPLKGAFYRSGEINARFKESKEGTKALRKK